MKDALADSEFKETIKNTVASYTGPNAASQISSFGIGVCLAFLGQYLASEKRGSPAARVIARILGMDVDAINRDYILQRLKDKDYPDTVRKKILNVIQTSSSIDEFARSANLSPGEAWGVYRQIKDLIVDSEIIGMISRLENETGRIATVISNEAQVLRTAIDEQLNEVSKLQYDLYQTNGLSWLQRNYFEDHISTIKDTENWKNGFAFRLPSIMQKKEFRRCPLINQIKNRLEDKRRLLLVGETGTSKTTILMEILTDYFVEGYEILYNLDGTKIKNGPQLVSFIEKRLEYGDKILVVVDNVHSERTSAIFYAMDEIISSFTYIQNIRFLLAARIPEYDSFVRDRLNQVREGKESIRKFINNPEFRYDLPFFTDDEIKGFIKKYKVELSGQTRMMTTEDEKLSNLSREIFEDTRGHPIMVKFYLLGNGLRTDVKRRYYDYLSGDSRKMQIMLVCSLLDIGSLPITDELLQDMGLLRETYNLENATLYQPITGSWKTINPRWDVELLSFLYNETDKGQIYDNKQYLKTALDVIFNIKEEKISATEERTYSVIRTIYGIVSQHVIPVDIIESVLSPLPSYLTDEKKAKLYTYYIAPAYWALGKFQNAIDKLNEALTFMPDFTHALINKGKALDDLGRSTEALKCYDKAIDIDPNDAVVWNNKGLALRNLGKYNEAIESFDKAIERDANYVHAWINKGNTFHSLEQQKDADRCFAKASESGFKPQSDSNVT
ncbi:MAG: tetratricopeptide repeat protein [Candidatus Nitrosopolaris sp.]